MKQPVFRFAPSPNGYLHLGHALSALIDFEMARQMGGRFLLRIEDIDPARCKPELETAIYEDLAWLGIAWEEPDFTDRKKTEAEMHRIFDICHTCRRCFNLCDAFPRLFDLIDNSESGELDTVASADYQGWQRWIRSSATRKDENYGVRFMPSRPTVTVYDQGGKIVRRFEPATFRSC